MSVPQDVLDRMPTGIRPMLWGEAYLKGWELFMLWAVDEYRQCFQNEDGDAFDSKLKPCSSEFLLRQLEHNGDDTTRLREFLQNDRSKT